MNFIGQWFHQKTEVRGDIGWQGEVVGFVEPGWYYVRVFDWVMGDDNGVRKVVALASMTHWDFYECEESMRENYERLHPDEDRR